MIGSNLLPVLTGYLLRTKKLNLKRLGIPAPLNGWKYLSTEFARYVSPAKTSPPPDYIDYETTCMDDGNG